MQRRRVRTHAKRQRTSRQTQSAGPQAASPQTSVVPGGQSLATPEAVIDMQRTVGNQAVLRHLHASRLCLIYSISGISSEKPMRALDRLLMRKHPLRTC